MLFNFIKENENFEEQRLRLTTLKAYTILYKGVKKNTIPTQTMRLDLQIPQNIPDFC